MQASYALFLQMLLKCRMLEVYVLLYCILRYMSWYLAFILSLFPTISA